MGFLDRLQGKNKVDPMAEVSATAVAHLREQNLKFQKFMRDKVQELEEKIALEQQRLSSGTGPDLFRDAPAGDVAGDPFSDYGPAVSNEPAADDEVRISLEGSVSLTDVVVGAEDEGEQDPPVAELEPEPVETTPEAGPEPMPGEETPATPAVMADAPPAWENLFGISPAAQPLPVAEAVSEPVTEGDGNDLPDGEMDEEVWEDAAETTTELSEPTSEPEKTAASPALAVVEIVSPPAAAGEIVETVADEDDIGAGGSLLWDWRSMGVDETAEEDPGAGSRLNPSGEPENDEVDDDPETSEILANEEDLHKAETVLQEPAQEEGEYPVAEFPLLEEFDEQEELPEIPLPDGVGDWS